MVSDTLRLPLRAEVASSSATRSSRSAQQSPPRSAALADDTPPLTANRPRAANNAALLVDFHHPPFIALAHLTNSYRNSGQSDRIYRTLLVPADGRGTIARLSRPSR